jgi:hypothetical protein
MAGRPAGRSLGWLANGLSGGQGDGGQAGCGQLGW